MRIGASASRYFWTAQSRKIGYVAELFGEDDFLTRARSTSKWKVLKKLGKGDELVELETSGEARKQNPDLPRTWTTRAIQYRRPGFEPSTLLTSLVDAKKFPADEIRGDRAWL